MWRHALTFGFLFCSPSWYLSEAKRSVTALEGETISLPCNCSTPVLAVYWFKLKYTGASDDGAVLVCRDYHGFTDPLSGFERFGITGDYSLVVSNISVHDGTTYSCQAVVKQEPVERNYVDLIVIAKEKSGPSTTNTVKPTLSTGEPGGNHAVQDLNECGRNIGVIAIVVFIGTIAFVVIALMIFRRHKRNRERDPEGANRMDTPMVLKTDDPIDTNGNACHDDSGDNKSEHSYTNPQT